MTIVKNLDGEEIDLAKYAYYDPKMLEEDMPEADAHSNLALHLVPLLRWLYRNRNCYVGDNLLIIKPTPEGSFEITPDISVFKGVIGDVTAGRLSSWRIGEPNRPAPSVVFEIASEKTWRQDLKEKVGDYLRLGVSEYFAYDPNTPPYWGVNGRLRGWSYSGGQVQELKLDGRGWLYSQELESWLAPNGRLLQLYDEKGVRRLNQAEEAEQREALERKARLDTEQREALERKARLDTEQKLQEALQKLHDLEKKQP